MVAGMHKQCKKDGMCYKHFFIEHPEESRPGAKTAKKTTVSDPVGPAPEKKEKAPDKFIKPIGLVLDPIVQEMIRQRDSLYIEIVRLETTLRTLNQYAGTFVPDLKVLRIEE